MRRAAPTWMSSSGNGAPTSSPRKALTRPTSSSRWRSTRARTLRRRSSSGSPSTMPIALRSARDRSPNAEPELIGSPWPTHTSTPPPPASRAVRAPFASFASFAPRAATEDTFSRNSCRSRDLPIPAAATTSSAPEVDSSMLRSSSALSTASSRSRPTHAIGLPSSAGAVATLRSSRAPCRNRAPPSQLVSNRPPSSPAVTSSIRAAAAGAGSPRAGRSCTARSMSSPIGMRDVSSARPVTSATGAPPSSARSASAQRAACAARSVAASALVSTSSGDLASMSSSCPW
ncbi:hypothetical protein BE15_18620 [Sorangium cellulosum]|uniref:Uncharacterized protein n=1 Tax=Sorangium cellulosum TaxID=56 RepID=A0A150Q9J4_SORCE|nr:hypothetical protein BE15_18620 [Sorangium cellulosum]